MFCHTNEAFLFCLPKRCSRSRSRLLQKAAPALGSGQQKSGCSRRLRLRKTDNKQTKLLIFLCPKSERNKTKPFLCFLHALKQKTITGTEPIWQKNWFLSSVKDPNGSKPLFADSITVNFLARITMCRKVRYRFFISVKQK